MTSSTDAPRPAAELSGLERTESLSRERGSAGQVVMVTGHRTLAHPVLVREHLDAVLAKLAPSLVVSGGAQGADSCFAAAAVAAGVPLELVLPNRWYRLRYPDAVPDSLLEAAERVRFAVERPDVDDWSERWDAERWWVDNFARNAEMVAVADVAVVVSPSRPLELAARTRGGTAHCVRTWASRRGIPVVWVPDVVGVETRWAPTVPPSSAPTTAAT